MQSFSPRRILSALVLAVALSAGAWPAPSSLAAVWPHEHGDLAPDPAVHFGVLANGMHYAILRNQTPKGQVSIRFRLAVGSLNEAENERGLAHLLEHMAFRGSTHVPESEVWAGLQRLGMATGADSTAYTQETQTYYLVELPNADAKTLDFGLTRMRETASELNLDPAKLETERGPVLGEESLRDTPDYRDLMAQRHFIYKGLLLPERSPIGVDAVIEHAQIPQMRAFYNANYRPERATLIVVGDIDPNTVEAQIKAHFDDWRAIGPARPDPDLGALTPRGLEARVVVDPKQSTAITVAWVSPYDGGLDSRAKARRDVIAAIGLNIISRRLRVMANGPTPPFVDATLTRRSQGHSAVVTVMGVNDQPQHWRSALHAAEITRRQALAFGVTQDEVDQEVGQLRARIQEGVASANTRRTPGLAQALMNSVDSDSVFTSPAQFQALFEDNVRGLTAAEVTGALKTVFSGSGPLVFISSANPLEGGEAAVAQAFAQFDSETLIAPPKEAKVVWPYEHFGPPGAVAERRYIADVDATQLRFANGVRLTVKPTKFATDQILVSVAIGHGLLDLPQDRATARWIADSGAFIYGGLGELSLEDLEKVMSSKIVSFNFGSGEDHFELSGVTRPADLDSQMQILAAYATDPGFRPEAFEHVRRVAGPAINNQNASPGGVMQRQLPFLLHSGDPRWAPPLPLDVATVQMADMRQVLADPLSHGPIDVTMVGDLTVDQAIAAVSKTFAALPPRPAPAPPPPEATVVKFPPPPPAPLVRRHAGRDDQAIFLIAWPVADARGDLQTSRDLRILEQVIKARLWAQFRVAEGASYEADTSLETSQVFPGYGYIYAFAEAPPDKEKAFYDAVSKITADLRAHAISADELERARQPRVELFTRARQTNSYWLGALNGAQTEPRRLDMVRTTIPALKQVTANAVLRLARTYLGDDQAWRLNILPRSLAPPPTTPRPIGVANLDCARTEGDRLRDCHVLRETPPGQGVGATALIMAPNLRLTNKTADPGPDQRVKVDVRVPTPDPGP